MREDLLRGRRTGALLEVRDVLMEKVNLVWRLDRFDTARGEGKRELACPRSGPIPMERKLTCAAGE